MGAHIVRMAPFEAAGFLGAAIALATANSFNIIVLGLALGMFAWNNPTPEGVAAALELSIKEKEELNRRQPLA